MKRLFFSQSMLDSMIEAGKIRVDKGVLTMLAGDNPTFALLPAYRIVRTIDDGADPSGLVGQIRSEAELKGLGAEIYMDSVIYKDIAYQADTGFIAEKRVPGQPPGLSKVEVPALSTAKAPAAKAAPRPAAAPGPAPKPAEAPSAVAEPPAENARDADQLSQFILDNLL